MRASEKLDAAMRTAAGRKAVREVLMGGKAWVEIDGKRVRIGMRRSTRGQDTGTHPNGEGSSIGKARRTN